MPLVASPMQVARLRDAVRRVAFGDANKALPMAAPSSGQRGGPPPVLTRAGAQSSPNRHSAVFAPDRGLVRGSGPANRRWDRNRGSRWPRGSSRADPYASYDARNCAHWFARFEERSEVPKASPKPSEVRRLQKAVEALRRLVTGEQIP